MFSFRHLLLPRFFQDFSRSQISGEILECKFFPLPLEFERVFSFEWQFIQHHPIECVFILLPLPGPTPLGSGSGLSTSFQSVRRPSTLSASTSMAWRIWRPFHGTSTTAWAAPVSTATWRAAITRQRWKSPGRGEQHAGRGPRAAVWRGVRGGRGC